MAQHPVRRLYHVESTYLKVPSFEQLGRSSGCRSYSIVALHSLTLQGEPENRAKCNANSVKCRKGTRSLIQIDVDHSTAVAQVTPRMDVVVR